MTEGSSRGRRATRERTSNCHDHGILTVGRRPRRPERPGTRRDSSARCTPGRSGLEQTLNACSARAGGGAQGLHHRIALRHLPPRPAGARPRTAHPADHAPAFFGSSVTVHRYYGQHRADTMSGKELIAAGVRWAARRMAAEALRALIRDRQALTRATSAAGVGPGERATDHAILMNTSHGASPRSRRRARAAWRGQAAETVTRAWARIARLPVKTRHYRWRGR